ncbi:MAG: hypothetical protein GAK29_03988 [Acinetobacter bereziniae]|uniref:Uncharacterized protein n=1 Tax=Acinetobacter bereziniae TaxID=106648 RepID=A0A833PC20_ACIBZ|nr:MAG: hypothetical protein GAK29_03988 [Acinetobacter bereziniae]
MNIKEKNYYFGYDEFKKNIPVDVADIENFLTLQDRHGLNHNWSFLRMNHDYIELIDQYYARLGKGGSVFFVLLIPFLIGLSFLIFILFNPFHDGDMFLYLLVLFHSFY